MTEQYKDGPNTHTYRDASFITEWTVFHLDDPEGVTHTFHVPSRIVEQIVAVEVAASVVPEPSKPDPREITLHPGQHEFRTVCRLCGEEGMLHVSVITHHERVTISDPRSGGGQEGAGR